MQNLPPASSPPERPDADDNPHGSTHGQLRSPLLLASVGVFVAAFAWILLGDPASPWQYLPQILLLLCVTYLIAAGANWLVDAAGRIARRLGVSNLLIGLTVVAMGTSAPELAASLSAGLQGRGDITVANVIGSNIFNICFILGGVAAIVGGLRVERALLVRDVPVLLAVTVALFLFVGSAPLVTGAALEPLLDLRLARVEGLVLLGVLIAYLYVLYRVLRRAQARQNGAEDTPALAEEAPAVELDELPAPETIARSTLASDLLWLFLGILLVVGGSHLLVGHGERLDDQAVQGFGALWFARVWEIPDYIVGVTVVAAGTSAPELVISLVAALRGAYGMSAGNLIGSDLFNMLGVLGISGIVLQPPLAPAISVTAAAVPSLLALSAVMALTLVFMWTGKRISRIEGLILLALGILRWGMDFGFRGTL